jgi:hypothetical protein
MDYLGEEKVGATVRACMLNKSTYRKTMMRRFSRWRMESTWLRKLCTKEGVEEQEPLSGVRSSAG